MRSASVIPIIAALALGTAGAPRAILGQEFNGEGVVVYQSYSGGKPLSNFERKFRISVKAPNWKIRSMGEHDLSLSSIDLVYDGTNYYRISRLHEGNVPYETVRKADGTTNRVPLSPNRIRNQATVHLSRSAPPDFDGSLLSSLWLAYASFGYFHSASNSRAEPFWHAGHGLKAHGFTVDAFAQAHPLAPGTPSYVAYICDGNQYKYDGDDLVKRAYPKPYNRPFTNAVYRVVSFVTNGEAVFPSEFSITRWVVGAGTVAGPTLEVSETYEGKLDRWGGTVADVDLGLDLPQKLSVVERRFALTSEVSQVAYFSTNAQIRTAVQVDPLYRAALIKKLEEKRTRSRHRAGRIVVYALLALAILLPAVSVWRRQLRN
jgi:hypothetical protein